jgi:hypothetical protein
MRIASCSNAWNTRDAGTRSAASAWNAPHDVRSAAATWN